LVENAVKVPRVHDLEVLVTEVMVLNAKIADVLKYARILSAMAVEVRYPGMTADEEDSEEALRAAMDIRGVSKCLIGV